MPKSYIILRIRIPEELFDPAIGMLYINNCIGIEESLDELIVTFYESDWSDKLQSRIEAALKNLNSDNSIISVERVEEINWNEEWESNLKAIKLSQKAGIAPKNKITELDTEIRIIIDPKMSFGTGTHETTRLMCQLLENSVQIGSSWIDAGTGTGILAILAVKLGARRVLALDNDEWSILNAKENVLENDLEKEIKVEQVNLLEYEFPESDGIAANINSHLIKQLLKPFYKSLAKINGVLLLSGLLITDKDEILKLAENTGFCLIEIKQENEWIALHLSAGK